MKIAVDAMGGDKAPEVVVQGAFQAAVEWGIDITFVGDRDAIEARLAEGQGTANIQVHHCEDRVRMDEAPLKALRRKKEASVRVAFDLVKKGVVDAVVSAGNTGAVMVASRTVLGPIRGVARSAIRVGSRRWGW